MSVQDRKHTHNIINNIHNNFYVTKRFLRVRQLRKSLYSKTSLTHTQQHSSTKQSNVEVTKRFNARTAADK